MLRVYSLPGLDLVSVASTRPPFVWQPINYKFDHSFVLDAMKKYPGKVRRDRETPVRTLDACSTGDLAFHLGVV